jgi:DNA-3-methyladenine glycosylase II
MRQDGVHDVERSGGSGLLGLGQGGAREAARAHRIDHPGERARLTDEKLRASAFSRQRTAYVRGLAQQIMAVRLSLEDLERLSDETVRERLIQLRGIGNWTIDVYLILVLHRIDLFPVGDLAAVNGLRELNGLLRTTTVDELRAVTREWAPYRTVGTFLVWHYYLSRRKPRPTA